MPAGASAAPSAAGTQARVRPWRVAFAVVLCGVLYLALRSSEPGPDWFENADKLRHLAAFVVLGGLGLRSGFRPWTLAVGLLLFGIGIELAQSFTPTREASGADAAADGAGIALALLVERFSRRAT